jgi:hypothetical protein
MENPCRIFMVHMISCFVVQKENVQLDFGSIHCCVGAFVLLVPLFFLEKYLTRIVVMRYIIAKDK